jgi:benzoate-CoA ligase
MISHPDQLPERFNAAAFFVDANISEGRGARCAFRYRGASISYAEVAAGVARAAQGLLDHGLRAEDRVLLVLPDCPQFAYAFFGAIKAGIVPVPVHTMVGPEELRYYLEDSAARALMVHEDFTDKLRDALPARTIVASDSPASPFSQLMAAARPLAEPAPTHRDDMAFWLYTSGSTGRPKGAVHLQRDMVYAADLYAVPTQQLTAADRIYSASKMYFAYGLGNSLYCPFRVGACSILVPERPNPEICLRTIVEERPTHFFAVPTLYAAILNHCDAANHPGDTSSLRLAVSAGEALPAELYRRFRARFSAELLDGIGSTEMLHIFITNRVGDVRPGASGKPVDGYRARIVDEEDHDVQPGEIGNLWISGGSAAAFYWRKAEQTRRTMRGEWMVTGDKYRQDADGYYWYCGRSDDMLRAGAQWISPVEVEGALITHPAVAECAVASATGSDGLSYPKAFVVLRNDILPSPALADELKAAVRERLAHYKTPREIAFLAELPKTATGKIQRFKLRS